MSRVRDTPIESMFVDTLFTRLQSVNREKYCIERVKETRTVSFRVPRLAKTLYDDALSLEDKEQIKYLVEGLIYALAREKIGELPCEDSISKRLVAIASITMGKGTVVFNINMNMNNNINNNENKNEVRLEIPREVMQKLDDLLDLLEFIAYRSAYPANVKKRAENGYQAIRQLRKVLIDLN